MKLLNLSIELSNLALDAAGTPMAPNELLHRVQGVLEQHGGLLGDFTSEHKNSRDLGTDLRLSEYQLNYERHSVQFEMVNFLPRNEWEVQGIRLL